MLHDAYICVDIFNNVLRYSFNYLTSNAFHNAYSSDDIVDIYFHYALTYELTSSHNLEDFYTLGEDTVIIVFFESRNWIQNLASHRVP